MSKVSELQAQITSWENRRTQAQDAANSTDALALTSNQEAESDFRAATTEIHVAERAIAALKAQLPAAEAADLLQRADELAARVEPLLQEADEVEVKVNTLLRRLEEVAGCTYVPVRMGEPKHLVLRNQAGRAKFEAANLRREACRKQPGQAAVV